MKTHDVTIRNFAYSPREIRIEQGDTVVWTSEDGVEHTVTADGGEFDSGDLIKGGPPFQYTFKSVGEVEYGCRHHHGMRGKVSVTASKK
jgi:plastocyanin